MIGGTVIIDDFSEPGSWALHIAHTPSLRLQCPDEFPRAPSGRIEQARFAVQVPLELDGNPGGAPTCSPNSDVVASPGTGGGR